MKRYFYDLAAGKNLIDKEGVEQPDFKSAKAEAVRYFGETLRDDADAFTGSDEWEITVRDEKGLTLLSFIFLMIESSAIKTSSLSCLKSLPEAEPTEKVVCENPNKINVGEFAT